MSKRKKPHRQNPASRTKKPPSDAILVLRLVGLVLLLVLIVVGIFRLGIPLLSGVATFWDIFSPPREAKSSQTDTVAPSPPFLAELPSATNNDQLTIHGYAEPGSEVEIFLNGDPAGTTITDNGGEFIFDGFKLFKGTNAIYTRAKDQAENASEPSRTTVVILDKEPPELEVTSPGVDLISTESTTTVSGRADPDTSVFANDRQAIVGADGTFSILVPLNEGENTILVKAVDAAGNETAVEKVVTFVKTSE